MSAFRVENNRGTYLAFFSTMREAARHAMMRSCSGAVYLVFEGDSPYESISYRRGKKAGKRK